MLITFRLFSLGRFGHFVGLLLLSLTQSARSSFSNNNLYCPSAGQQPNNSKLRCEWGEDFFFPEITHLVLCHSRPLNWEGTRSPTA